MFSSILHNLTDFFKSQIKNELIRPIIGGLMVALAVYLLNDTQFIGLGIPTIVSSFTETQVWYVFFLKIVFTTLTIATGFKGGEVTPLFFIGATLGSALSAFLPLPVALLSGMGFVAVFAGATNTPIACLLMGIELFGSSSAVYIAIAVMVAYIFSGHTGIYLNQVIGEPKNQRLDQQKDKNLKELL
jgi:H+/Cl- antiporter ClcA